MNRKILEPCCPFHAKNTTCTKQIRLFQALPDDVQQELIASATSIQRHKGYVFASDGDPVTSILIIRKGNIKTYRLDAAGNEYLLDVLHEEQAIWHDMFLKEPVYHYSIEAISNVDVCEISTETFLSVLNHHPEAALSLIQMLSTELTAAKEKILLLSIRSPEVRTAGFLLERWNKSGDDIIFFNLFNRVFNIGRPAFHYTKGKTFRNRKTIFAVSARRSWIFDSVIPAGCIPFPGLFLPRICCADAFCRR